MPQMDTARTGPSPNYADRPEYPSPAVQFQHDDHLRTWGAFTDSLDTLRTMVHQDLARAEHERDQLEGYLDRLRQERETVQILMDNAVAILPKQATADAPRARLGGFAPGHSGDYIPLADRGTDGMGGPFNDVVLPAEDNLVGRLNRLEALVHHLAGALSKGQAGDPEEADAAPPTPRRRSRS